MASEQHAAGPEDCVHLFDLIWLLQIIIRASLAQ